MTTVTYKCVGKDGQVFITAVLAEAKNFVTRYGGSYTIVYYETRSDSEAYARPGYRHLGSRL